MGLENPILISDFVDAWPTSKDQRRFGDDHLRAIKRAIKNTFAGVTGQVTATHSQLNSIPTQGVLPVITELKKHIQPKGVIQMWSGSVAAVPVGWALCNGQNVAGYGVVPDLRDRFVVGAGNSYSPGATGGSINKDTDTSGTHVHTINGTALSVAQIPAHTHAFPDNIRFSDTNGTSDGIDGGGQTGNRIDAAETHATGGGDPHTHTELNAGAHSHSVDVRPPYYALAFIIKVIDYVEPPAL